jgi:hypothetical protein
MWHMVMLSGAASPRHPSSAGRIIMWADAIRIAACNA